MSRSSGRGQVEPLAALVAVVAVCAAVSLHAGVLDARIDALADNGPSPERTLDRVHDRMWNGSTVDPGRLTLPTVDVQANASLATANRRWTVGPAPPSDAARAARPTAVRLGPGRVEPARIRVVVW
jgi:hypothetical protein